MVEEELDSPLKIKLETPTKSHHPLESVFSRLTKHVKVAHIEINFINYTISL